MATGVTVPGSLYLYENEALLPEIFVNTPSLNSYTQFWELLLDVNELVTLIVIVIR